jgi:hypothetical protein
MSHDPDVRIEIEGLTKIMLEALNKSKPHDFAELKAYNKIFIWGSQAYYEIVVRLPMEETQLKDHRNRLARKREARNKTWSPKLTTNG